MTDRSVKKRMAPTAQKVRAVGTAPGRWLTTGALTRKTHFILAHGAGAGMESAFLNRFADLLDAEGVTVHRFAFSYMAARSAGGGKRPAPRADKLIAEYLAAVTDCRARIRRDCRLFIGGKSMGGRIACLASEAEGVGDIAGVAVLGFPLVPPGKPKTSRANVLEAMTCPALIVQGTRDPFGGEEAFAGVRLRRNMRVHWVRDGDHDLKPRKASQWSHEDALHDAARAVARFFAET